MTFLLPKPKSDKRLFFSSAVKEIDFGNQNILTGKNETKGVYPSLMHRITSTYHLKLCSHIGMNLSVLVDAAEFGTFMFKHTPFDELFSSFGVNKV
jgi:hypothetical protein